MRTMRHAIRVLAALLACGGAAWAGTADPATVLRAVRSPRLDPGRAVSLSDVEIRIGQGTLAVERGILVPAQPIEGRTLELVFVGQAAFRADPADDIEAGQLELFTGRPTLDAAVEEVVLVVADQNEVLRLLDRPIHDATRQAEEQAQDVFSRWAKSFERTHAGVLAGMYKSLVDDPAYRGYFALWCRGHRSGEFVYTFDPQDAEQLTVAAFDRLDLRGWDRTRVAWHLKNQQRKGRFLGLRVEDIGSWDVWTAWPASGSEDSGFEPRHYEIDATVLRGSLRLAGHTRLHLEATASGVRTLSLELFRDLVVDRVVDEDGRELFFFRAGPEVVVQLPRASRTGESLVLDVTYEGQVLEQVQVQGGRGDMAQRGSGESVAKALRIWDLQSTTGWYPHAGTIDRATYDVTLRWPSKYRLLTGGGRVGGGESGGYRWERRRIDLPAIAASFVLGRFDVVERQAGRVRLALGFEHASGRHSERARSRTVDAIERSLVYFEELFGPYPLADLTVVMLPRNYSQSFLGFVTLTDSVARAAEVEPYTMGAWIRETTVAHEIAHQWWGNLVGWQSYRDQWLSEATANYAGLLFHASSTENATLADLSVGWRATLNRTVPSGRTLESLGPVVLGSRLNSSQARNGYTAIVYRKGAVVLAMLARVLGEERFLGMLRELVHTRSGGVITTESFLAEMEKMSGIDLDGFARQYVYGTGIPLVYYDYEVEPPSGDAGWRLVGEARRLLQPRLRSRLDRRVDGTWDVVREPVGTDRAADTALLVPFRVAIDGGESAESGDAENVQRHPTQAGQLRLLGQVQPFSIEVEARPLALQLDPEGEILANFYSRDTSPKRCARYHGQDLMLSGYPAAAERELQRALSESVGTPEEAPLPWMRDSERDQRTEDLAIRLSLARLYLDLGRDRDAEDQLRQTEELAKRLGDHQRMERDTLWARLELRRGDFAQAYRRLKQTMRTAAPRHEVRDGDGLLAQMRLRSEYQAFSEAYALFAVAALETGNGDDYAWAIAGARDRGVDTLLLEQARARTLPEAQAAR
jgi:hypothetical protein